MRTQTLAVLTAGLLALSGRAQPPVPVPNGAETTGTVPPSSVAAPDCACVQHKTTYELHWVEREVPATITTAQTREVSCPDVRPTLKIEFQTEQRCKTE